MQKKKKKKIVEYMHQGVFVDYCVLCVLLDSVCGFEAPSSL